MCASVSQLVSERAQERVVVGRQTTAFVLSCDTAERSPLISCLYFLQSSETAHPMLAPLRRVWYMRTDSSDPV